MQNAMVDVIPIESAHLDAWEPAWRELEARLPGAPPYVCFDWLSAWVDVYAPQRLAVVRTDAALGLLELGAGGRWRFAGRPVGSERGMLGGGWEELGRWLRSHARRWATLEAACMPAGALPDASRSPVALAAIELPGTFDEYLAGRSSRSRTSYRRALRRAEGEMDLRPVAEADLEPALADLVALHARRAASVGERHPAIDGRLARLLARQPGVRTLELVHDGRRIGVHVRLDRPGGAWSYTAGIDPDALALGPGVTLELASIRDAIERGLARYDLGPGDQPYKLSLGATFEPRFDLQAASPSVRGRVMGAAVVSSRRARERLPVRTILRRLVRT
jgi:CelD/BcsL family acetyltransferase involved in cellulose biosynthesis